MIQFNNTESLARMIAWFKKNQFLPKAMLTHIEVDPADVAASEVRVNFGSTFDITFFAGVVDIEDLCRCHNDEIAAHEVRTKIAAFLGDQDTFTVKDFPYDLISTDMKEQIHAFATYFG